MNQHEPSMGGRNGEEPGGEEKQKRAVSNFLFLRQPPFRTYAAASERDVEAQADIAVHVVDGDVLLADFSNQLVHADEQVKAFGMEIDNPTHGGTDIGNGTVDAGREPAERSYVG